MKFNDSHDEPDDDLYEEATEIRNPDGVRATPPERLGFLGCSLSTWGGLMILFLVFSRLVGLFS